MPSSAQQHRVTTELFYSTHSIILEKKWNKQFKKLKSKPLSELCTWGACLGLSFAYICLLLLLLSNDVEQNPGPEASTQLSSSSKRCYHTCMDQMEQGWATIQTSMRANAAYMHYDIGARLSRVEGMLSHMAHGINELIAITKDNTNSINALQSNQDIIAKRLNEAERDSEKLEEMEKQSNVKILGLLESSEDNVDQAVNLLNHFSSDPQWNTNHIEKAYRVGKRLGNKGRTMIVTFSNLGDKVFVLRDNAMRDKLRREGIRITSDLTTKQQAEIDYFRDKGFRAYYKRGLLQVEDSHGDRVDPSFVRDSCKQTSNSANGESNSHYQQSMNGHCFTGNNVFDNAMNNSNLQQQRPYVPPPPPWLTGTSVFGIPPSESMSSQTLPKNNLYPPLTSPTRFTTMYGPNPSPHYPTSPRHPYYHPTTDNMNFQSETQTERGNFASSFVGHMGEPSGAESIQDNNSANGESLDSANQHTSATLRESGRTATDATTTSNDDVFDDDDAFYGTIDASPNDDTARKNGPISDVDSRARRGSMDPAAVNPLHPDDSKDDMTYAAAAAAAASALNLGEQVGATGNNSSTNKQYIDTNEQNKQSQNQSRRQSNINSKIPTANKSIVNSAVSHRVDPKSVKDTKTKASSSSVDKDSVTKPKSSTSQQTNLRQSSVADYALRSRSNSNTNVESGKR